MPDAADLAAAVAAVPLVDHHVHGALTGDLDRAGFEQVITESDEPAPPGTTGFDSQVGFAVRRWCAPLLDLPAGAPPEDYLRRRAALGAAEVNRRLLSAAGVAAFLVETGYLADRVTTPAQLAEAAGSSAYEVVRIETVAEQLATGGVAASDYPGRLVDALAARAADAVGLKSIVAYRHGFDFPPGRPDRQAVVDAAGSWLRTVERTGVARLTDPTLLRHGLWAGIDFGRPLQVHAGYGDADLDLHRCDPLLLTEFIRRTRPVGTPIVLLHCYPYHRQAGYLAQVYPHVYFDVGCAVNYTGLRSVAVVGEALELAPFGKLLYSSDAWGPAELHLLGARLWRWALGRVLGEWVDAGLWSRADALRVAALTGWQNAVRLYGVPAPPG